MLADGKARQKFENGAEDTEKRAIRLKEQMEPLWNISSICSE